MTYDPEVAVRTAIRCSIYASPRSIGLSSEEIVEACSRVGFRRGEICDAIDRVSQGYALQGGRLVPLLQNPGLVDFHSIPNPDPRCIDSFEYVFLTFRELARDEGVAGARIDRAVLVARARADGFEEKKIEAAVTAYVLFEHLREQDGVLSLSAHRAQYPSPKEQYAQVSHGARPDSPAVRALMPAVEDAIARRTDGRSVYSEPLAAFSNALVPLGYKEYRMWWTQMVAEVKRLDPHANSTFLCVGAAALIEGALTFVVKHARSLKVGPFMSSDFDGPPNRWKIDDLVNSASRGQHAALLDTAGLRRAQEVIATRQRIHAGRMLTEYPGGAPDLKPEQGRHALETAEMVVRKVLDWLEVNPVTTASPTSSSLVQASPQ